MGILVRGDSAYGREDIMSWCESQDQFKYVLTYSINERLQKLTWELEQRAKVAYEATASTVSKRLYFPC